MNKQYDSVSKKIDLVEYIYYLQYQMEIDNITVETMALNPNPPKHPKSKKDCNLFSLISGC